MIFIILALLVLLGWLIIQLVERAKCKSEGIPYMTVRQFCRYWLQMQRHTENKKKSETKEYHIDITIRK